MSAKTRPLTFIAAALAVASLGGCATAYKSFYKQTDMDFAAKPLAAKKVKVVKSKDDLVETQTQEVGIYRGHAPTIKEAMNAAKQKCGEKGADFYVLNTEPFLSDGVYKVDGTCQATVGSDEGKPAA